MVTTVTDNSPQSINTSLFSLDKEVQEIKKVTDKLAGINTESGVISVNGKQGIVELDASDVNALPSSTVIPTTTSELENTSGFITINDVGASFVPITRKVNDKPLDKDITLTASDVGALPNTTVIPTKTSELTNNSGFITKSSDITGNAATATTAKKVANALTVNGKTYDGSSAVNAGVQTVANGGTGVTTQAAINRAFIGNLDTGESDVTDGTEFVSSYASNNGFAENAVFINTPYKRKFSAVWNYIKGKISSVLGLTKDNYGGTAATILDYVKGTPIKVRWGGHGINSAEWYPAFNADGSALEPINRANIHAGTAVTADKTVNDISIDVPWTDESGQYVIPFGNILAPTSTATNSPYNWDITGFFSIIRPSGHNGSHIQFEAGHGYSHDWTTYAYLDKFDFRYVTTSIKAFQYNGKWWLGLCITTINQGYSSKMTVTYSRGLPATPTCILYYSRSNGVVNEEIHNSLQDIPSSWWIRRNIYNPTTFTQDIVSPSIKANNKLRIPIGAPSSLEDGCIWIG